MMRTVAVFAALGMLAGCAGQPSSSQPTDFRIYRANSDLQLDKVPALNTDQPGCHNMLLGIRIYRVAQIGFEHCSVYAEKGCREGSEVPVSWKNEEAPVTQFGQGDRWFLVGDHRQGHTMGSWYCKARE
jgi:hypothetical protein